MINSISNIIGNNAEDSIYSPLMRTISLTGITNKVNIGDSIAASSNASSTSLGYSSLLNTFYGWTGQDISASGRGYYSAISQFNTLSFTRNVTVITDETALNDIRRSHTQKTFNKIETALHGLIVKAFSAANAASGSATVTRSGGTFSSFNAQTAGGVYPSGTLPGNFGSSVATVNAKWSWTFTGDNFYVAFSGSDGSVARGPADVKVDGVLIETVTLNDKWDGVNDGSNDNTRGPVTKCYFGFGSGSHTVEVICTTTSPVAIDRFGTLDSPSNLGVFVLVEVPKILDYSKAGLNQASDAYIDQVNMLRKNVALIYANQGYKIYYAPIMLASGGLYDLTTDIDTSDNVHPTTSGHSKWYNSIKNRIVIT